MAKKRRALPKRIGEKILLFLIPFFAYGLLRLIRLTMRIEEINREAVEPFVKDDTEDPLIIAFWHSRLLMMPFLCRKNRVVMLISRHRDGELISQAVRFFPVDSIRGSTTRGGTQALRELLKVMNKGCHVAITPDGPRGPRNVAQPGAPVLASRTGRPIVPLTFAASKKKIFNSWDRFLFPYPFSRGVFIWGDPIWVSSGEGPAVIEEKRKILESRLNHITTQADHYFDR